MAWSSAESGVLVRAISHAPSVHNTQPWTLQIAPDRAELHEDQARPVPRHDPSGRDRLLSCGAALATLEVAARELGRAAEVELLPDGRRPGLLATIRAGAPVEVTAADDERYAAIFRRRSYRAPFALRTVCAADLDALVDRAGVCGVTAHRVRHRDEIQLLADQLIQAAGILRADRAYQRELVAWTTQFPDPQPVNTTLPWHGLVRADTHIPDRIKLAERLGNESLLILHTPGDTRRDHLTAGVALQHLWLTAVSMGLVASLITQPLHLAQIRTATSTQLDLGGYPHALMRVGYPVNAVPPVLVDTAPVPRTTATGQFARYNRA